MQVRFSPGRIFNYLRESKKIIMKELHLQCILNPSILSSHPGMDRIVYDFLSNKEYNPKDEVVLSKKVTDILCTSTFYSASLFSSK